MNGEILFCDIATFGTVRIRVDVNCHSRRLYLINYPTD